MLIKAIISVIVISFALIGCSHKDDKGPVKAPHKVHNKFHYKNMKEDK